MSPADNSNTFSPSGGEYRYERDALGERAVPVNSLFGIHTLRAIENFPLSGRRVHPALIHAFGRVKLAAARTNRMLGAWEGEPAKADAVEHACREMAEGMLDEHIVVDALQGGAGTSTNMNVNEVLANRAILLLGKKPGDYSSVSPLDDINLHQSTNDTYPTALKLAAITLLRGFEERLIALQEAFQQKEKDFAHIVKIGRTQLQDAVLITLGREMGAYAEAIGRDRWRVYKCEERLRVVNLGGTAIGTGLAAPREYIFRVVDVLREETGIGLARAENLVENTQNADVFVEVSGILKACAATLIKISTDLRLLSSGPVGGIGEISLPPVQAGSSIMPDKINPVIPEAVTQAAIQVMGCDLQVSMAAGAGNLELNPFLPVIADALLRSIELLSNSCDIFRRRCVEGIEANEAVCRENAEGSTAAATALVAVVGYDTAVKIAKEALSRGCTVRQAAISMGVISDEEFDMIVSPEAVMRLGHGPKKGKS
ncbi:MAG: aspartate ammonia-lyase [Deltaproteobacteria bacterium]|nr:aspartate ammonia-lyase [Candidatus Zymogenaceae bacterium]